MDVCEVSLVTGRGPADLDIFVKLGPTREPFNVVQRAVCIRGDPKNVDLIGEVNATTNPETRVWDGQYWIIVDDRVLKAGARPT